MKKMFSVYDSKVGAYLDPMFFRSKGEAIRAFSSAVADSTHQFHKYASDFTLFELGSWDELNAKMDLHATPVSVGLAIDRDWETHE